VSDTDLENLPPLRNVIREYDLRAEKSLGQNFLLDLNLTRKIARAARPLGQGTVFEIGPGPGGLTRGLLMEGAFHVVAVEYDSRAIKALQPLITAAEGKLELVQADALKTDLLALYNKAPRKIVANLPYNIATPLLISWLKQIHEDQNCYESLTLMFQKEVAQRITALPETKIYGRLSVLTQWLCDTRILFDVPPSAFTPPPKVTSTIVELKPKKLASDKPEFSKVENLTAAAFGQRRKMIRSSLKNYSVALEAMELDAQKRAEDLKVEDYIELAKLI